MTNERFTGTRRRLRFGRVGRSCLVFPLVTKRELLIENNRSTKRFTYSTRKPSFSFIQPENVLSIFSRVDPVGPIISPIPYSVSVSIISLSFVRGYYVRGTPVPRHTKQGTR